MLKNTRTNEQLLIRKERGEGHGQKVTVLKSEAPKSPSHNASQNE